jgi:hypothetical protein
MPELVYQNVNWSTLHSFVPDSNSTYIVIGCNIGYLALYTHYINNYSINQLFSTSNNYYRAPYTSFEFTEANKTDLSIIKLNNNYNF